MKTTKGIPCNKTRFTNGKDRNRIVYQFVTDDGNTPSGCTIRFGDTDPMTGEEITDIEVFRGYYKEEDHQVHKNNDAIRQAYTREQKTRREEMKQKFIRDFELSYGYTPSKDDVLYFLEQHETERYHLYLDATTGYDGEPADEFGTEFMTYDEDPFGCDLPDDLYALKEIAESLKGWQKEIYGAMLQRAAGGTGRITYKEIADQWGVSYTMIIKNVRKIEKLIRERVGPKYQK